MTYFYNLNTDDWPQLSPEARKIFKKGAEIVLEAPQEWLEKLDEVTLSVRGCPGDPVLAARTRKHNRQNIYHWAIANVNSPGDPVEPDLGSAMADHIRDLVQRGTADTALHVYRAGQNEAYARWIEIIFELTDNAEVLQEVLRAYIRSSTYYVDSIIKAVSTLIEKERKELLQGTQAVHRDTIKLILNQATISEQSASRKLGYRLDQTHRAVLLWYEDDNPDTDNLEKAVRIITRNTDFSGSLIVVANSATRWVWLSEPLADLQLLFDEISKIDGVRVAFGTAGKGIQGFRRSHQEAVIAQRILVRSGREDRIVDYDSVYLIALLTRDEVRIKQFLNDTLGGLYSADPVIRQSVYAFLESGCNIGKASELQSVHRNTMVRHLARADELLPKPLEQSRIRVTMALEVMRWYS